MRIDVVPVPAAFRRPGVPLCSRCRRVPVDPRPGNCRGDRWRSRCVECQREAVLEAGGITEGEEEIRITRALRELRRQTSYLIPTFEEAS